MSGVLGRAQVMRLRANLALGLAASWVVVVEAVMRSQARYALECAGVALALAVAWLRRDELATAAIVGLAVALPAAIAIVHLARHANGDVDVARVYPVEGGSLLHGTYPHSEYPPGAVLLFAFETWAGSARTVNPFVMAVSLAAVAWAICAVRTPEARWLAAVVSLWPVDAFFWEYKFDALPTGLLLLGATAALRRRWLLAGALLGAGTAVKWSPAVAAVVLVGWLLSQRSTRDASRTVIGFVAAFAAIVMPVFVWSPSGVLASITRQAPRTITPESIWYLPLHAVGLEGAHAAIYAPAAVPHWTNAVAAAIQVLVLVLVAGLAALRRPPLAGAVASAVVAAALFLLLNKVFSAQYMLTVLAASALGAALVGRARALAVLLAVGTAANALVYPIGWLWLPASALLFASSLTAVGLVMLEALGRPSYPRFL